MIADVAKDSKVAQFLDGYVGAHNGTGHEGIFLDNGTVTDLAEAGWTVDTHSTEYFPWVFSDEEAMAHFCHQLFDLRTSTADDTRQAIKDHFDVQRLDDKRIGMEWSLMTIVALKPEVQLGELMTVNNHQPNSS